ncbi:hypothetical protein ACWEIJ_44505 [Lentzea sp. NPDC004789]
MTVEKDDVGFDIRGDIFQMHGTHVHDRENWRPGKLTLNVANGAGKWVDVVIESTYPQASLIWQTSRMSKGSSVSQDLELNLHRNKAIKVTRWAPGFLDIPGSGGGEVFFVVPDDGDVTIDISVTG